MARPIYLRLPWANVLHIPARPAYTIRESGNYLSALCPARFQHPSRWGYWCDEPPAGARVCGHCARIARRQAAELLAAANGPSTEVR